MRKSLFFLIVILLLIMALWLTTRTYTVSQSTTIAANKDGLMRNLIKIDNWTKWGPQRTSLNDSTLIYKNTKLRLKKITVSSFDFNMTRKGENIQGLLTFVPLSKDSVTAFWSVSKQLPLNPARRIKEFFAFKGLDSDLRNLSQSMKTFYNGNTKNIYGYDIKEELVVDSILLSTFSESTRQPTTGDIYNLIDQLQVYLKRNGAREKGHPMLNVFSKDGKYLTRVAIPTDKVLPPQGNISYKWMLPMGNILIAEVQGGQNEISNVLKQIEFYIADHSRQPPAIPFLSLVTDRRVEPDSTKWITRIYYPVM